MSTVIQTVPASSGALDRVNENNVSMSPAGLYGKRPAATTGLTWGYYGGNFNGVAVLDGTIGLTASSTNYLVAHRTTGVVSVATNTTNWNNQTTYMRLQSLVVGASTITSFDDFRQTYGGAGSGGGSGTFISLSDVPAAYTSQAGKAVRVNAAAAALEFTGGINNQTGTTYTLVAADHDAEVIITNAASNTLTVPPNASVAIPIGGSVAVKQGGAGVTTIAPGAGVTINTASTLKLGGANCIAILTKEATDVWTLTGELAPTYPQFAARAWVNFDGTGAVAIRASGNVSSITDNGTGDYTVNFTTAMPDANYAPLVTAGRGVSGPGVRTVGGPSTANPTTTAVRLVVGDNSGALQDLEYVIVAVVR